MTVLDMVKHIKATVSDGNLWLGIPLWALVGLAILTWRAMDDRVTTVERSVMRINLILDSKFPATAQKVDEAIRTEDAVDG